MTGRPSAAARLMAGWLETSRPATLPEHLARYGPPPLRGPAGRRGPAGPGPAGWRTRSLPPG